jgi:hypothetical protein
LQVVGAVTCREKKSQVDEKRVQEREREREREVRAMVRWRVRVRVRLLQRETTKENHNVLGVDGCGRKEERNVFAGGWWKTNVLDETKPYPRQQSVRIRKGAFALRSLREAPYTRCAY